MLGSEQVKNLVLAMGAAIGDTFDLSKVRYHKLIIATDADVDGAHIRTLLLTFFFRYYRPIIDAGYVYIAQPPLYKITHNKQARYAYSDQERDAIYQELGFKMEDIDHVDITETIEGEAEGGEEQDEAISKKKNKLPPTQRYKGLGEMNPEELKETTMDPNNRTLKVVSVEEAEEADKIFEMLMGSEVGPRKSFIQTYAKQANLDI
jgi:DNA gyrase subunit B